MKTLELHYPMIQFLINQNSPQNRRDFFAYFMRTEANARRARSASGAHKIRKKPCLFSAVLQAAGGDRNKRKQKVLENIKILNLALRSKAFY